MVAMAEIGSFDAHNMVESKRHFLGPSTGPVARQDVSICVVRFGLELCQQQLSSSATPELREPSTTRITLGPRSPYSSHDQGASYTLLKIHSE